MTTPTYLTVAPQPGTANGYKPGDTVTGYARFWLAVAGPIATLIYVHLWTITGGGTHAATFDLEALAADLGGLGSGRNGIWRKFERLHMFHLLDLDPDDPTRLVLRATLPALTDAQLNRIRPQLAREERLYREAAKPAPHPAPAR